MADDFEVAQGEAGTDKPKTPKRLNEQDWGAIADYIKHETDRREGNRSNLDKQWDDIDRQVAMSPDISGKLVDWGAGDRLQDTSKNYRPGTQWMPELELPLQAEALEILNADARRIRFPPGKNWFKAFAFASEEWTRNVSPGVRILIEREGASRAAAIIAESCLEFVHGFYDMRERWDRMDAGAFKYGVGLGNMRMVDMDKFVDDYRGRRKIRRRFPCLVPASLKTVLLDDSIYHMEREQIMTSPSYINRTWMGLDDIKLAAAKGGKDPTKENGGWMPNRIKKLDADSKDNKSVKVMDFEGDLLVPRSRENLFLPNVLVTVAQGKGGHTVIRYRERSHPFRSYLFAPYQHDDVDNPYATSPLMKGRPIQTSATEALNRLMQWAILNTEPPIEFDKQDFAMAAQGGPMIEPGAKWDTIGGKITPHQIGDGQGLLLIYQALLAQYADVTGITAPRLGQQTKSHQTAFAIESEQARGQVRTVDYVSASGNGALTNQLYMEWEMLRSSWQQDVIYIREIDNYMLVTKQDLPEIVDFQWLGQGGPVEEREAEVRRLNSLAQVIQLQPLIQQTAPDADRPDLNKIQRQILQEGGWSDPDRLFISQAAELANRIANQAGGNVTALPLGTPPAAP